MIPQVCFSVFKKIQNYFEQHRQALQLEHYDSTYDSGSYPSLVCIMISLALFF